MSKWVEAIASPTNDHKVVMKLFKSIIFPSFGVPKIVISDGGSHFANNELNKLLKKYSIVNMVGVPYHPQTQGQVEVANREIKQILENLVNPSRKDWSLKLDGALWAHRICYNTPIGSTPFRLLYGKSCHLPVELECRSWWAIQALNLDPTRSQEKQAAQLR